MIKVLFVIPITSTGGIEKLVLDWIVNLDSNSFKFELLSFSKGNNPAFDSLGIPISYICIDSRRLLRSIKGIKSFFSNNHYDVLHLHVGDYNGIVSRLAKKEFDCKVISHSHLDMYTHFSSLPSKIYHKIVYCIFKKYLIRNSDRLFACSTKSGTHLYGKNAHFQIIKNGIETNRFRYSSAYRDEIRISLGICDEFVVMHVGRFSKVKNHAHVIDSFFEFQKIYPFSILVLLGDGELRNQIEQQCVNLGIVTKVKFVGYTNDTFKYYSAADLLLLPSFIEGYPITIVEAQTSGLTSIVSDRVTDEISVTDLVCFMDIFDSPLLWARMMLDKLNIVKSRHNRVEYASIMKKLGFDKSEVINLLNNEYLINDDKQGIN